VPAIHLHLEGDGCWPDLPEALAKLCSSGKATGLQIAGLAKGMVGGAPSVTIRLDFVGGAARVVETSLALFLQTAALLKIRYGDPRPRFGPAPAEVAGAERLPSPGDLAARLYPGPPAVSPMTPLSGVRHDGAAVGAAAAYAEVRQLVERLADHAGFTGTPPAAAEPAPVALALRALLARIPAGA
jgi:hypothetical protein